MYEIVPLQDKEEQNRLAGLCGQKFDIDSFAYAAYIDKEFFGICQFKIERDNGLILGLSSLPGTDDLEVIFMTGRAALNFIDLCGVHYAIYKGEVESEEKERLLRAIGFKRTESGSLEVDLNGFFTDHCHDKNKEK